MIRLKNPWLHRLCAVALSGLMLTLAPTEAQAGRLLRYAAVGAALGAVHVYSNSHRRQSAPAEPGPATTSLDAGACAQQLPMGRTPTPVNPAWREGLTTLCFQEYAVGFSSKTRTPLWSAEHLTRARIESARAMKRSNTFHEEESLPWSSRSHLKDFVRSGFDRGHMSPSGDMSTAQAQNESFSLANMIPQDPDNNRHVWEGIESGTRNYALSHGSLYVVTGPLFIGKQINFINDRVAVPTHIWKLLYDPAKRVGGVFVVENIATHDVAWRSISDFEQISGYHFNLGTPALMDMPTPRQHF